MTTPEPPEAPEPLEPAGSTDLTEPTGTPAEGAARRRRRRRHRRPRRLLRAAVSLVVVLVAVVAVAGLWFERQVRPGSVGAPVDVTVPAGASTREVGSILAYDGVVAHPRLFDLYAALRGARFHPGVYPTHHGAGYARAISDLSAASAERKLTIPEGYTLTQIAGAVGRLPGHSSAHFLAVARSGQITSPYEPAGAANLEGLLFPDTYQVDPGETDQQILQAMVNRFVTVAHTVGLDQAPATVGIPPYQALTVASMIEREAKVPADRGLVAQVIYNRLHRGMRLQVDATVLYAIGGTSLTPADFQVPSPYNTYVVTGLPPGPIASPGEASLAAALHPTPGDFLYYVVVQPDGKEAFSSTLAGQQANIALARSRGLPG